MEKTLLLLACSVRRLDSGLYGHDSMGLSFLFDTLA